VIHTSLQRLHSKRKQSFRGEGEGKAKQPLVLLAVSTT
jgi:hypothetical protein